MTEDARARFLKLAESFGTTISSLQIKQLVADYNLQFPYWFVNDQRRKLDRGMFRVSLDATAMATESVVDDDDTEDSDDDSNGSSAVADDLNDNLVPHHHRGYVKFGFHDDLSAIVGSGQFWPVFIAGESGFGKTQMVYECCHERQRELIRVQISQETDKISLFYAPQLKEGTLTYDLGPVPEAMQRGAILLLDELDRGTHKLICMNGVLEGKPWYNEKTQKLIYPKPGFNVIATGNSKGQGSSNSGYLVQILDNAFLERFAITVEHDPPPQQIEEKILRRMLKRLDLVDDLDFAKTLAQWGHWIRDTIADGSDDIEMVSTRRLLDICKAFKMFQVRSKAIKLCLNRFDKNVQKALSQQYELIDVKANDKLVKDKDFD